MRRYVHESLSLFRALDGPRRIAHVLSYLARVALLQGDIAEAYASCKESLALFQQVDDPEGIVFCLQGWGVVVAQQNNYDWAARLWGTAETLCERGDHRRVSFLLPIERTKVERIGYEQMISGVRTKLGERAFAAAWAEGQTMTPEQALAAQEHSMYFDQSFEKTGTKAKRNTQKNSASDSLQGCTKREGEVLRLVAQGLTDAQMAEALVISPRTVHTHLRAIYSKLGISSRHAAMHYALAHHLV